MRAQTRQELAVELVPQCIALLCNQKQIMRSMEGDEDLRSHLTLCALENTPLYRPEDGLPFSAWMMQLLKYAALEYVRKERWRGIVASHRIKEPPEFAESSQTTDEDEPEYGDSDVVELPSEQDIADAVAMEPLYLHSALNAMHALPQEDCELLQRYCGLDGHREHTLKDLAEHYGWKYPQAARRRLQAVIDKVAESI